MSGTVGNGGFVTSWSGTVHTHLITGGSGSSPFGINYALNGEFADSTVFASGAVIVRSKMAGPRSWSATIEGHASTPAFGFTAGMTYANGYVEEFQGFTLDILCDVVDTRTVTSNRWRNYLPGLMTASGTYDCMLTDGTTAASIIQAPARTGTPSAATFTIATGITVAGSIMTTSNGTVVKVGELNVVRYNWELSGNLTFAGATNIYPLGAGSGGTNVLATPAATTLEAKLHELGTNDKRMSGSAFFSKLSVVARQVEPILVTIEAQGTGDLSHDRGSGAGLVALD